MNDRLPLVLQNVFLLLPELHVTRRLPEISNTTSFYKSSATRGEI